MKHGFQVKTAIESILSLSKIPIRIFLEFETMIRASNGGLQVTQYGIDPGKTGHLGAFTFRTDDLRIMDASGDLYRSKTGQAIGNHCRCGR